MAETANRVLPQQITTTTTTILTAGAASTWKRITTIIVANTTAAALTVTVGIGTANTETAAKRIISTVTLDANAPPLVFDGFATLLGHATTPDLLYALCSVTNGATIFVDYVDGP